MLLLLILVRLLLLRVYVLNFLIGDTLLTCMCLCVFNSQIIVGAGTNKQHAATKNTAKLDRENEELKHDKIPMDVGKIIQQGRNSKGLSQKDLATVS